MITGTGTQTQTQIHKKVKAFARANRNENKEEIKKGPESEGWDDVDVKVGVSGFWCAAKAYAAEGACLSVCLSLHSALL